MTSPSGQPGRNFQAPRGTRDFYPIEMARRLWLEDKWRRTATRHGFDEISGPTFEHLDLYTVKSGEGIVSELFSFSRQGGETSYALRPEFTPTLARMVASKANALPKPIKWHSIGPYFRAERPQRGRLREFTQWNVDVLGDPSPEADAEVIACCADSLRLMGLTDEHVSIRINHRGLFSEILRENGVPSDRHEAVFVLLDQAGKLERADFLAAARKLDLPESLMLWFGGEIEASVDSSGELRQKLMKESSLAFEYFRRLEPLRDSLEELGVSKRMVLQSALIVRGLAYYTGAVFEVHETGGKERAIAGGGRYDNLVELFGGPPTPAVGFAMGDVVIALVLQDKGLMPSDDAIARDLGLAPDVFVFACDEAADLYLRPMLAHLRRAGLHARRTYKTTRNEGKLFGEANKSGARFVLKLMPGLEAQLKDMGAQGGASEPLGPEASVEALAAAVQKRIPAS